MQPATIEIFALDGLSGWLICGKTNTNVNNILNTKAYLCKSITMCTDGYLLDVQDTFIVSIKNISLIDKIGITIMLTVLSKFLW